MMALTGVVIATLGFVSIPALLLSMTSLAPVAMMIFVGVTPALIGSLYSVRVAASAALGASLFAGLAVLVSASPVLAGLVALALVAGITVCTRLGYEPVAAAAAGFPAVLMLSPHPTLNGAGGLPDWLIVALIALAGGAWACLAGALIGRFLPTPAVKPVTARTAVLFGVLLAIPFVGATVVLTTLLPDSKAGWVLLTMVVIARPATSETWRRAVSRASGTLAGGVVAVLLGLVLPVPALAVVGIIALVAAVVAVAVINNYAVFCAGLTMGIVLLSARSSALTQIDIERVVYTVAGTAIVAAVVVVAHVALGRTARARAAREETTDPTP